MSSITLSNGTRFPAAFVVHSGDELIAKVPGVAPNGSLAVPTGSPHEADTMYSVYAVINGVTTDMITTPNPSAHVRAVVDDSGLADGHFRLIVA